MPQKQSGEFLRKPTHCPGFGRQIAVISERHTGTFPAQRVHDSGEVLAAGEQVLVEPHPRRMRAHSLQEPGQIVHRQVGQRPTVERPLNDHPVEGSDRAGMQRPLPYIVLSPRRPAGFDRVLRRSHASRPEKLAIGRPLTAALAL